MTGCSSNYYRQIPGKIYPAQQVSGANLTRNSGYYSKKGLFWLEFRMLWRIFEYPFPITGAFTNINFPSAGVTRWKELRFFLNGSAFPLQYKHMFHRLDSHNRQQKKEQIRGFCSELTCTSFMPLRHFEYFKKKKPVSNRYIFHSHRFAINRIIFGEMKYELKWNQLIGKNRGEPSLICIGWKKNEKALPAACI